MPRVSTGRHSSSFLPAAPVDPGSEQGNCKVAGTLRAPSAELPEVPISRGRRSESACYFSCHNRTLQFSCPTFPPKKTSSSGQKRLETGTVIVYTAHAYPIHPPSYTSDLHSNPPSSSPKCQRRYDQYRTAMTPLPIRLPPFPSRILHYLPPSTEGILHRPPVDGCHFTHKPMTVNTPGIPSY